MQDDVKTTDTNRNEDSDSGEGPDPLPAAATNSGHKHGFLRDYLSMAGFNVLSIGISFLNTSALLALLGRAAYGDIVSCTSMGLLISTFATDWSALAAIRFGTEEYLASGHAGKTFWNRLFIIGCCVGVALPVIALGARLIGANQRFTGLTGVFLTVYLPLAIYWLHVQRYMPSIRRHDLVYPLLCLERAMVLSVIGACHYLGRLSVGWVLAGYVLGSGAAGGLSTYLIRKQIGRPRWPDRESVSRILNFSWPLIPSVWIGALSSNALDYLLVGRYVGSSQLGVYSLGVQISGIAQQLPQIAGTLLAPRVVGLRLKGDGERLGRFVRHDFVLAQWCWVALCFGGAAIVSWQGPRWIPPGYDLLTTLAWPLAMVTTLLPIWYVVWNPILAAFERTRTIMWASVAGGLANVAANFVLIPRFGAIGSALATVAALIAALLMAELSTHRSEPGIIPRRGLAFYLPALAGGLAGLAGHLLTA